VAADDINLETNDGELVCFLGPSGSGKTTLMRMISGLETPTEGRIYFDDEDVTDLPTAERNIAMVFQFPAVYPDLTVYENMAAPLRAEGLSKDKIREKVLWAAKMLHMEAYLDRRSRQLDMSVLQRVSVAKAIVRNPRVFLFDEPLSNLDAKLRDSLRYELKRLHTETEQTMIYVTHDQVEAMALADRIAVLKEGKLQQFDTPENIFHHPANKFVAYFIGSPSMNFIESTLHLSAEKAYAELGKSTFDLEPIKGLLLEKVGERVTECILGIRPQNVEILFKGDAGTFKCKVLTVESLGTTSLLGLSLDDVSLKAMWDGFFPKRVGEDVWIKIDPAATRIIDKKSEMVIA